MAWKDRMRGPGSRRFLAGANLLVYTAVVVAIIVVANVAINRYADHRWDLTANKQFSLSPQSRKILKELKKPVTIYSFNRQAGAQSQRDLLELYSDASPRVEVRYVDPDRDPALARQYDVHTYGTIVVVSGSRHYQTPSADEEGVTNALIRLLTGQKAVYFMQGHGERDLEGTDREGYSDLKKQFDDENYDVKTLTLLQTQKIPSDCTLLVIAGPRTDYLPAETDALGKYVEGGGRLLVMLDAATDLPNLFKLLAGWNVTVKDDLVIDTNLMAQLAGAQPTMPLIYRYGSSPITAPLQRTATLFPFTRSFVVGTGGGGVVTDALCETTDQSYGVADFNPSMHEVRFRPGKDYKGPLTVAVSASISPAAGDSGAKKPQGRVVATGTSLLAANVYLGEVGNRDLVMNMVNWLTSEENLISIRPKAHESQHLEMNAQQMRRVLFLGVLGLPLVIILLGVGVWWGRR
jgi:gliding motility-associatede transport system auxiliary component